ncbi:DMT family transporter [Neisseriaceae bacterium CLB008]
MKAITLGSGWMVVTAICFSLMGAFVKAGSAYFGPFELTFWRTAFGVLFLGGLALMRGYTFYTPHVKAHIGRGVAGSLGILCFFYALVHLPLATAVTLNYTSPMALAILSVIVLKERLSRGVILGLVLGFIGVALLLRPTMGEDQLWYGLVGLAAGFFAGWAYLQVRELAKMGEEEWRIVFYFSVVCTVLGALLATFDGWHAVTWENVWYLLGLGVTATAGQMSMTRAYKVGRKYLVAALSYLNVVFSTLLGVLWLGDGISVPEVVAMVIIVLSGIITGRSRG